jgi:hypothetical protein
MATQISNTVISLTGIDGTDCLGDSRTVINTNITTIGQSISSLSANTTTQINNLSTVPYARLNDGNQTGSAPIFGTRAWVYFNGLSGLATLNGAEYRCALSAEGNVSKVVWLSAGQYNVHFETALPSKYYAIVGSVEMGGNLETFIPRAAQSTAAIARVNTQRNGVFEDASEIHALFIG